MARRPAGPGAEAQPTPPETDTAPKIGSAGGAAAAAMGDFARMFSASSLGAMPSMEPLMRAQQKNMEALAAANRSAMEAAATVAKRHMELMQQSVAEFGTAMQKLAHATEPQAAAQLHAELAKAAYTRASEHMREMGELIRTMQTRVLEPLNRRMTEAAAEINAKP